MATQHVLLMIGVFVLLHLSIFALVFRLVAHAFNQIADRHPPVAPTSVAVRRNFQSLAIDWCNLGGCVHMSADELRWHLEPSWILRVCGARKASVPWDALREIRIRSTRARTGTARLGRMNLRAPAWCLRLAGGGATGDECAPHDDTVNAE